MLLSSLGADQRLHRAFEIYSADGLVLARVATAQRDHYSILTETGEVAAEPSGTLWYQSPDAASMPVTGDWVAARVVEPEFAIVEAVLPRRTLFARRAAGAREDRQPLAANIDVIFVVCGLDGDFNLRRIERYLTLIAESGASPVVVLNKSDLAADLAALVAQTQSVARSAPVIAISAHDAQSLTPFLAFLGPGITAALVGSSGVGKSTIVNRLLGEDRMPTSEVRASDSRGRHTTVRRELLALPAGGAIIDTPGLRELQLWAGEESVDAVFDDIGSVAARCRFRDCTHSGEPGCAVQDALSCGAIDPARWESYSKLRAEARWHETLTDPLADNARKRKWKLIHKAQRAYLKLRQKA